MLLAGQTPAHEQRCPAVGNTDMSVPISAMMHSADPAESTTLQRVLVATVRGAGASPAPSGFLHEGKPTLAGHHTISFVVAANGHGGLTSNDVLRANLEATSAQGGVTD